MAQANISFLYGDFCCSLPPTNNGGDCPGINCCLASVGDSGCQHVAPCDGKLVPHDQICRQAEFATVVVFGRGSRLAARQQSIVGLHQQQQTALMNTSHGGHHFDLDATIAALTSTQSNGYAFTVCEMTAGNPNAPSWVHAPHPPGWVNPLSYDAFVSFLIATRDLTVGRHKLRVWSILSPPTEANNFSGQGCLVPKDSPLTPQINESAFFEGIGPLYDSAAGYVAWAKLAAALAREFPAYVAFDIDDFAGNIASTFSAPITAEITSALHRTAPWMAFVPTIYYKDFQNNPGLAWQIDAPVFFFENAKQGAGPCAAPSCPWGPAEKHSSIGKANGCLAGNCAAHSLAPLSALVDLALGCCQVPSRLSATLRTRSPIWPPPCPQEGA